MVEIEDNHYQMGLLLCWLLEDGRCSTNVLGGVIQRLDNTLWKNWA